MKCFLISSSVSVESLAAKAFYYIQTKEYQLALPYLEKALEYNPNSSLAVQMLADFYLRMMPNSNKYLEFALKGAQLNVAANYSVTQSYFFINLSNPLVISGFIDGALKYVNMSLDYNAKNYFAPHLKEIILLTWAVLGNSSQAKRVIGRRRTDLKSKALGIRIISWILRLHRDYCIASK